MNSSALISLRGGCPAPFYSEASFANTGGCMSPTLIPPCPKQLHRVVGANLTSCSHRWSSLSGIWSAHVLFAMSSRRLVRPSIYGLCNKLSSNKARYSVYPDSFSTVTTAANWLSVVGALSALFLLVSWAFLPVDRTSRHYLSISLTIGVFILHVSICHRVARPFFQLS